MGGTLIFKEWQGERQLGPISSNLMMALGWEPEGFFRDMEQGDDGHLIRVRYIHFMAKACMEEDFDAHWDELTEEAQCWVNDCVKAVNEADEVNKMPQFPDLDLPVALYAKVEDMADISNKVEQVIEKFDRKNISATQRVRELVILHPGWPIQRISDELNKEGFRIKRSIITVVRSQTKETLKALKAHETEVGASLGSAEKLLHTPLTKH